MHDMVHSGSARQARSRAAIYAIQSAKQVKKDMVLSAIVLVPVARPSADPSASEKVSFVTISYRRL